MSDKHALLSASSAFRWLRCTPSAIAESHHEDQRSSFAEEGTLAHALAARELMERPDSETLSTIKMLEGEYHNAEMDDFVAGYVGYVREQYAKALERDRYARLVIEQRVYFNRWVPDGFGTADALIITETELDVIDLKYGRGVEVKAPDNPQLRLYAVGAMDHYLDVYDFKTVRTHIVQPRLRNLSTETLKATELLQWADEYVAPLAMVAARGLGARCAGSWCRFCRAAGECGTLGMHTVEMTRYSPDTLTNDQIAALLPETETAEIWVKALRDRAMCQALQGERLSGYKLVKGRQTRTISDEAALIQKLTAAGYGMESITRPRQLKTLTDLQVLCGGKRKFEEVAEGCITLTEGRPALVPESDRRKAWNPAEDFAGMIK